MKMGRGPAITRESFDRLRSTMTDVQKREKETLQEYVLRINRYSGIHEISAKTLSRINRSGTYEDYLDIIKRDSRHPGSKPPVDAVQCEMPALEPETAEAADLPAANDSVTEILLKVLQAVTCSDPVGGSSIDKLSMNICGGIKKNREENQKAMENLVGLLDAHLSDIGTKIGELYELINIRIPAKVTAWEDLHKEIKEAAQ